MVRIGSVPMRLMALKYGADLVFSPELVDCSLLGGTRVPMGDFIEYRQPGGKVIFRLHQREKKRLIIQLGSSDVGNALVAASLIKGDCAGIDLNCGCPKRFSTHAGMGAALLENPNLLYDILSGLSRAMAPLPVSVKIRILPQGLEATKKLITRILGTGIRALSIHGRTRYDTYDKECDWATVSELVQHVRSQNSQVFVNLSGDVFSLQDAHRAFEQVGVDGVLVARAAQWNVSVFSPAPKPLLSIIEEYLLLSRELNNHPCNSKYAVVEMLTKDPQEHKSLLREIYKCKTIEEMLACLGYTTAKNQSAALDDYEEEDLEFGYTKERQEARMNEKINKILFSL